MIEVVLAYAEAYAGDLYLEMLVFANMRVCHMDRVL